MSLIPHLLALILIVLTVVLLGTDPNSASIIIFIVLVGWIVYKDRKKFERQSIMFLRRTRRGKKFIITLGTRFSRFWKVLGSIGVVVGVAGALWVYGQLIFLFFDALFAEQPLPGFGIALPTPATTGSIVPGAILIPFWYWIIALALLVIVHEGFHAIMAAAQKIKLKDFGLFLLAIIPGAFVEPDEKQFQKEKKWKQLRVLAAGSFANFILAAVVLLLGILFLSPLVTPAGVGFNHFIVDTVEAENITLINGEPVASIAEIQTIVNSTEGFVSGETRAGERFFITRELLASNGALLSEGLVPVFPDLPAVRANLSGTIVQIDDQEIKTHQDLSDTLTAAGPGKEILIVTEYAGERREFTLTTTHTPEPEFIIDSRLPIMVEFERAIPGSIDTFHNSQCIVVSLFGSDCFASALGIDRNTRTTYQFQLFMWEHIAEEYPDLQERALEKIVAIEERLQGFPEPGYIGIANPTQQSEYLPGFESYAPAIAWISGLVFWLFLINLGVGLFNMLPVFITDGARIWYIIFERVAPKHAQYITVAISLITVFLVIAIISLNILRA